MVVYMDLKDFIIFISENYCVEVNDENVELVPFNNMQHKIIKENDYDDFRLMNNIF